MPTFSVCLNVHGSARHLSCLPAVDMKMQISWTAPTSGLCQRREPCSFQATFHEPGNPQSPAVLAPYQGTSAPRHPSPCQAVRASANVDIALGPLLPPTWVWMLLILNVVVTFFFFLIFFFYLLMQV